jgi:hypothetical protein
MTTLIPRWQFAGDLSRGDLAGLRVPIEAVLEVGSGLRGALQVLADLLFGVTDDSKRVDAMAGALTEIGVRDEADALRLAAAGWMGSQEFQWR